MASCLMKKRYGKNEKAIIKKLKEYEYVEYSIRALAAEITGIIHTPESKYNSIRNAVDRLEKAGLVETIKCPVYGANSKNFPKGIPTRVRMVRLKDANLTGRDWDCRYGVSFSGVYTLNPQFSNCKV